MREAQRSGRRRPCGAAEFFFELLSRDQFSYIEFDVWDRLCTHFEAAKVRTFATVTQHLSVSTSTVKNRPHITELFFFYERARNRSRKDREREDTDFAQYSRKQE